MTQSVVSVVAEVQPESEERIRKLIGDLRRDSEASAPKFERWRQVPGLHFVSLTLFDDPHFDPLLVIEINFDGSRHAFWPLLEKAMGAELRAVLACTKDALVDPGGDRKLRHPAFRPGSTLPLAGFIEDHVVLPAAYHRGNPELTRERIWGERALVARMAAILDEEEASLRAQPPTAIHATLRGRLLPEFPWLERVPPPRRPLDARLSAWSGLVAFGLILLAVLLAPGALLGAWAGLAVVPGLVLILTEIAALGLFAWWYLSGERAGATVNRALVAAVLVPAVVATFWAGPALWQGLIFVLVAAAGLVAAVLAWLRRLERADPVHLKPRIDEAALDGIRARENRITQNHLASLVLLKPGLGRAFLMRVSFHALSLLARTFYSDGYLGSMRTIHFAHWAIVGNGTRLAFFSNFDGTWESYLDDFIEKAAPGLTVAWTHGVGFPPTRYLVLDGATNGRLFKAWARLSQRESLFWFSAYEDLTVNQIERNAAVAEGLRRPELTDEEARTWCRRL